jgi:hypothetical protein
MNILFITWADSFNFWIPPLAKEFKKGGVEISILVTKKGSEHNRMLDNNDICKFETIDEVFKVHKKIDVCMYGTLHDENLFLLLEKRGVFCVSIMDHLVPNEYVFGSGFLNSHLTFCLGKKFVEAQKKNGIKHTFMPLGAPQYDELFDLNETIDKRNKTVLFLEQHFYPAGKKGKLQLAQMLYETAIKNPDYQILIKPRTLRSEINNATHKAPHLYNYLQSLYNSNIPQNLILLEKHSSLNILTNEADIVATTFSAAIYPAILLGKKVIIVNGFHTIDTEFYSHNFIEKYYEYLADTGSVVEYNEFSNSIKNAQKVKSSSIKGLYETYNDKVSTKMIEVIQYIVKRFYSNGRILPLINLNYTNYKEQLDPFFNNEICDFNTTLDSRIIYRNYTRLLGNFYELNLRSGLNLISYYEDYQVLLLNKVNDFISSSKLETTLFFKVLTEISNQYLFKLLDESSERLNLFPLSFKNWYFKSLYDRKYSKKLLNLESRMVDSYGLFYYLGLFYYEKGQRIKSYKYFSKFLDDISCLEYKMCHLSHDSYVKKVKIILREISNEMFFFKILEQRKKDRPNCFIFKLWLIALRDYSRNRFPNISHI